MRGEHGDRSSLTFLFLGGVLVLYLAAPLAGLLVNLSGGNVSRTLQDPLTRAAIFTSLGTATTSTVITAVLGVPLAYFLARSRFAGRSLINVLVALPLVLPPVSAGILLLILYGPYGTVGSLLSPHGIALADTASGIVLAQVFVSSPFVVVTARSAFEGIDREYEEAALTMGASRWQVFRLVALPIAGSGIVAGLLLGWMRALGEFGATVILAYHPYSLPVLNYVDLTGTGLSEALPLALITLLIAGTVVLAVGFVEGIGKLR